MSHIYNEYSDDRLTSLDTFRTTVSNTLFDDRGKILIIVARGWFLSLGVRMMYPVLLPYIRVTYGLSLTAAGLLLSVLWFSYAIGQLPGSVLADRVGEGTNEIVDGGLVTDVSTTEQQT